MGMKKVLLYPLWRVDELENKLRQFELAGWRVKRITLSCVYEFAKAKSQDSDYIVTYDMAKDFRPDMYEYEQKLLSDYSANIIASRFPGYNVYRITGENREFNDLKNYRRSYFKHVLFQYMLIASAFFMIGLMLCLATFFQKVSGLTIAFVYIYTFVSLVVFIYRIYGFIKQRSKCKKYKR